MTTLSIGPVRGVLCTGLVQAAILTLEHYVLIRIRILPGEESCLGMSLPSFIDHALLWGWAFRFGKVHDVLEPSTVIQLWIRRIIGTILLLGYGLLEL